MVHQRFQLVEPLTALENLTLGELPRKGMFFDRSTALSRARSLATELGTTMEWDRPAVHLSVGARQRLEIMRLLYPKADNLISHDPTTLITPQKPDDLFRDLRHLAGQ